MKMKLFVILFGLLISTPVFADGVYDLKVSGGFDEPSIQAIFGYTEHRIEPEGDGMGGTAHVWLKVFGVSQNDLDAVMAAYNPHDTLVAQAKDALIQEGYKRFDNAFKEDGDSPQAIRGQMLYEMGGVIHLLIKKAGGGTLTQAETNFVTAFNSKYLTSVDAVKQKVKDHIQGTGGETALSALSDAQLQAVINDPGDETLWD